MSVPTVNLPKIPTPRSLWVAAFWLDVIVEIVHGGLFRSYEVVLFFVISNIVVACIWYFERKLKKKESRNVVGWSGFAPRFRQNMLMG